MQSAYSTKSTEETLITEYRRKYVYLKSTETEIAYTKNIVYE